VEHFKDLFDGIFVVFSDAFIEAFQQEGIDFIKGFDEVFLGDGGVHIQNAQKSLLSNGWGVVSDGFEEELEQVFVEVGEVFAGDFEDGAQEQETLHSDLLGLVGLGLFRDDEDGIIPIVLVLATDLEDSGNEDGQTLLDLSRRLLEEAVEDCGSENGSILISH